MTKIKYLVLGILLSLGGFAFVSPGVATATVSDYSSVNNQALIELTNIERNKNGLTTLKESAELNLAAKLKAEDMVKNGYFAHSSTNGTAPWHWFKMAGYKYLNAGENLAILFNSSDSVVNAWMNSPSHRANILNAKFTEIGMAVISGTYNGVETSYVVEVFGNPDNSKAKIAAAPKPKKKVGIKVLPKIPATLVYKN